MEKPKIQEVIVVEGRYDKNALLQVVDASNPNYREQIKAVEMILAQIKVEQKPMIYVFNKIDVMEDETEFLTYPDSICVSAKSGQGLEDLKSLLYEKLFGADKRLEFFLPLAEAGKLGRFYALGQLDDVEYTEQGVSFVLTANDVLPWELAEYIKNGE